MFNKNNLSEKSTLFQYAYRIWTLHIVIIAIAMVIIILTSSILDDITMYLIITVACTLLYSGLSYSESWRVAARDRNLVMYEHIVYNKYKGLHGALLSQAPGIFFALVAVLVPSFSFAPKFLKYMYFNLAYPMRLLEGNSPLIYFVPIIIPFITIPLGYALGYKDFRILSRLVWKNPDKGSEKKPKKQRENLR